MDAVLASLPGELKLHILSFLPAEKVHWMLGDGYFRRMWCARNGLDTDSSLSGVFEARLRELCSTLPVREGERLLDVQAGTSLRVPSGDYRLLPFTHSTASRFGDRSTRRYAAATNFLFSRLGECAGGGPGRRGEVTSKTSATIDLFYGFENGSFRCTPVRRTRLASEYSSARRRPFVAVTLNRHAIGLLDADLVCCGYVLDGRYEAVSCDHGTVLFAAPLMADVRWWYSLLFLRHDHSSGRFERYTEGLVRYAYHRTRPRRLGPGRDRDVVEVTCHIGGDGFPIPCTLDTDECRLDHTGDERVPMHDVRVDVEHYIRTWVEVRDESR